MVRKTALVTAMLGAFASQTLAMGLGDIRLNSVLNQPLHAEIELLSPTVTDLAELRVALASSEAYNRAGVERAYFHTKLRFEVVTRPDGSAAIKVTSREAVQEPYLDFLLEATWGSGQVLREYTVLVDPPSLMPAARPQTQAPRATAPATGSLAAAPASAPPTARPTGQLNGEYHTSRSDTLWSIAATVRPDASVSMEQAMLGLLEANPDAFYDQNINNLKAGHILRVPSREEMAAVGAAEALSEVRRQNSLWRDGRATKVAAPSNELSPATTEAAPFAAPAPDVQPDAQLKLTAPETEAKAPGGESTPGEGDLRNELTLAVEAVEAQRQENAELNARLKQLEDQIAQLHRLIELKDSGVSQLSGTAAPASDADLVANAASEAEMSTEPDMEAAPSDDMAAPTAQPPEATTPDVMAETAIPEDQTPAPDIDANALPDPRLPETVVAEAPVAASTEDTSEAAGEGRLASLLANPMVPWAAVGAAVLAALLAWLGMRRRRTADSDFQESILAERRGATPVPAVAATAAAPTGAAADEPVAEASASDAVQSDSSLFTDFAVSDMGAIQNDAEADPIAEADVYLAYGRYQQAEELIRGALNRSPQRNDLRMKLLEVLFAAKNVNAFDAEAEALLAKTGNPDKDIWQRVVEMGQELNPASPLYREGAATATAAAQSAPQRPVASVPDTALGADDTDLDFGAEQAPADDNGLDFDLGELASFVPQTESAPQLATDEDLSFDLTDADEQDDEADGMLSNSDEVATKLDLARAYVEMGDPDGARSILEEVMQEGDAGQKSEAQTLLQQMG